MGGQGCGIRDYILVSVGLEVGKITAFKDTMKKKNSFCTL